MQHGHTNIKFNQVDINVFDRGHSWCICNACRLYFVERKDTGVCVCVLSKTILLCSFMFVSCTVFSIVVKIQR